jgi:hypothetical protein
MYLSSQGNNYLIQNQHFKGKNKKVESVFKMIELFHEFEFGSEK